MLFLIFRIILKKKKQKKKQWILSLSSNEGLNRVIHFTANGQDVAHFTAIG